MLELLSGVFAAASGGGAMGLVGGLLRQALDLLHKRTDQANELALLREKNQTELALRDKDLALMTAETKGQLAVVEATAEGNVQVAQLNAIGASFGADKATFATGTLAAESKWFVMVDVVRGLIRPAITLLFDLAMLAIWIVLIALLWDSLAALFAARDPGITKTMFDLLIEVTKSIIFLATTATGYWFVARGSSSK